MADLRANAFHLITGERLCWKCGQTTQVSAVVLDGYEEHDEDDGWMPSNERAMVGYITTVDPDSFAAITGRAPWLQLSQSQTAELEYLGNCCTACSALQGDWFLMKPDEIFFPTDRSQMGPFAVDTFNHAIRVEGELSWFSWLDWLTFPP